MVHSVANLAAWEVMVGSAEDVVLAEAAREEGTAGAAAATVVAVGAAGRGGAAMEEAMAEG